MPLSLPASPGDDDITASPHRIAIVTALGYFLVMGSYYFLYARHHLALSPEELFAISTKVTASRMLSTGIGYSYLYKQCEAEYSTENITCWQAIDNFAKDPTFEGFGDIYHSYLSVGAPQQANVPFHLFEESTTVYTKLMSAVEEAISAIEAAQRPRTPSTASTGGGGGDRDSLGGSGYRRDRDSIQSVNNNFNATGPLPADMNSSVTLAGGGGGGGGGSIDPPQPPPLAERTSFRSSGPLSGGGGSGDSPTRNSISNSNDSPNHSPQHSSSQKDISPKRRTTGGIEFSPNSTATLRTTKTRKSALPKDKYSPAVKEAMEQGCRVLAMVQIEVLLLLEKDTLPRFKASDMFRQYVEAEPLLFQTGGGP